ncbi:hypothetical protein PROFUN_00046 [Planoprotostelium fungivorum]|uniref:Uncharacterized protein n=1 Tax=Planoprotostelium fungivorum TaxID=1890364 RepID=A0A2P6P0H3_9EUKA|nr:hypothetical protein PROFUN_00046 [Planoprotostelium fungivorum]
MAQNLFALGSAGEHNSKPAVEFRAGKLNYNTTTHGLTADTRKGLFQIVQTRDPLTHIIWKDRTTGAVEDNLIIFPGEATFKKVSQCTTGRVFLLEFRTSARKLFFWAQDPSEDQDEENVKKVNQLINNTSETVETSPPPLAPVQTPSSPAPSNSSTMEVDVPPTAPQPSAATPTPTPNSTQPEPVTRAETPSAPPSSEPTTSQPAINAVDFANMLSAISRQAAAPTSSGGIQLSQLQSVLSNFNMAPRQDVILSSVVDADKIFNTLRDPEVEKELIQYLPSEHQNRAEIVSSLRSPQVQQAMSVFSRAIRSGELTEMMRELGIQEYVDSVEAFLQGMDKVYHENKESNKRQKKEDE